MCVCCLFCGFVLSLTCTVGILAGDFRHSDPEDSVGVKLQVPRDAAGSGCNPDELYRRYRSYLTSPFNLLKERGWRIAYKQSQVGPTSPAGRLVDYIATSRAVSAKARGLSVSSGHMPSRATEHAALSDHNFVEALFSVRFPENSVPSGVSSPISSSVLTKKKLQMMTRGLSSATWLSNGALAAAVQSGATRRERLTCEHEDLAREHRTEKAAAQQLQGQLSSEMRELRDQCHGQVQTVGMLTQRLADARGAVTAELRGAASIRTQLQNELQSEESQRRVVEASSSYEESEAMFRVATAEQQLTSMTAVRESLVEQLKHSLRIQDELFSHITSERQGRAELEVSRERELSRERQQEKQQEQQQNNTKNSNNNNILDSDDLAKRLHSVRKARELGQCRLKSEAALWQKEARQLREQVLEASEESRSVRENARRSSAALGASAGELPYLHDEVRQALQAADSSARELQRLSESKLDFQEQLDCMKEALAECRQDDIALEVVDERDSLIEKLELEAGRNEDLQEELDSRRSFRFLSCLFPSRRPHSQQPPLPPPARPPPNNNSSNNNSSNSSNSKLKNNSNTDGKKSAGRKVTFQSPESSDEEFDVRSDRPAQEQPPVQRQQQQGQQRQQQADSSDSDEEVDIRSDRPPQPQQQQQQPQQQRQQAGRLYGSRGNPQGRSGQRGAEDSDSDFSDLRVDSDEV
ncbi:unnamed protein product [Polarella glacialis]|uniref:Uncharacterized protein n=1 Tax=Polarella glacialis TaxID=89957 RepID=A0A813ELU2_POLGL|nr:unnamed protein product [Polarella glacialis]